MRRNFHSGELGDAVNCQLAGAAFNLVKRLNNFKMNPMMVLLSMIQAVNAICKGLSSPKQHTPYTPKEHQGYASLAL